MPTQPSNPDLYARLSVPGAAVTHHKRWISVDALRAAAALMVLASHAPLLATGETTGLAKLAPRLGVGVWIFFAASGYLIAGPFLRALLDGRAAPVVRRYAVRRAVRILPAYWVAFAAILLAGGASLTHWWQLPLHAVLAQGFVPGELKNLYLVAWSLGVEAIFYVLVPLLAWAVRRAVRGRAIPLDRLAAGVMGLWAIAVALTFGLALAFPGRHVPGGVEVLQLAGSLANFCPGMLVFLAVAASEADASSRWSRRYVAVASRPLPTLAFAAALLLAATELPFASSRLAAALQGPLFGLAAGLVLAAFVHGRVPRTVARVLAPVGLISYGVYLWHWVILSVIWNLHLPLLRGAASGPVVTLERVAMLVALTLPVAVISWLAIERPLLRRTAGWERREKEQAAARRRREEAAEVRPLAAASPLPASTRP